MHLQDVTPELSKPDGTLRRTTSSRGTWMESVRQLVRDHQTSVAGVILATLAVPSLVNARAPAPQTETPAPMVAPARMPVAPTTTQQATRGAVPSPAVTARRGAANPFSAASTPKAKLQLLQAQAEKLDEQRGQVTAEALATARAQLYADYVGAGGSLGLDVDQNLNGVNRAREIALGQSDLDLSANKVTEYELFKYFWSAEGEGLAHEGLDELTQAGVARLLDYARTHELDGSQSKAKGRIDPDERAIAAAIYRHQHYRGFLELDARPAFIQGFELPFAANNDTVKLDRPQKTGTIELFEGGSQKSPKELGMVERADLAKTFTSEYAARKAYYEAEDVTLAERSRRALALLRSYTAALWAPGQLLDTEKVGDQLLDAFFRLPYAKVLGAQDFNGSGWGVAQSLALGLDANTFKVSYPKAGDPADTTYLSMHGEMVEASSFVDAYLAAQGKATGAQAFEKASVLGFMLEETSGHNKAGNFDEERPFSTSLLNFGVLLFPGDKEVANLPVRAGFEFPIDAIDGLGELVVASPSRFSWLPWGDQLRVEDKNGQKLTVEKVIDRDASGKDVAWAAVFKDANGQEVAPDKVIGRIQNRFTRTLKGDGAADQSYSELSWWGFCDRNTAQRIFKATYGIPELTRDVTLTVKGKPVHFPKEQAQKLIDADISDLVQGRVLSSYRFDGNPMTLELKSGETLTGQIKDYDHRANGGTERINGDVIRLTASKAHPILGMIELQEETSTKPTVIQAQDLDLLERDPATGTVLARLIPDADGWVESLKGKLLTQVDWSSADKVEGKQLLWQSNDRPIQGSFTVSLEDGTIRRVDAKDVAWLAGETKHELRISQSLVFADHHDGIFGSDSAINQAVSNGMRWVNKVDTVQSSDESRPAWAPLGPLAGRNGPIVRSAGDKILWSKALYAYENEEPEYSVVNGWMHVDANGRIINEGVTDGGFDFMWAGQGKLNWFAESSFNPYFDATLRLKLFVNGVGDHAQLQKLADAGNLPHNWRDYLEAQPPPAPPAAETPVVAAAP